MKNFKSNIRMRIGKELVLIGSISVLLSAIGISIGSILIYSDEYAATMGHKIAISQLGARNVTNIMDREFSVLEDYAPREDCVTILKSANSAYPSDEKERELYIQSHPRAVRDNPSIREYMINNTIPLFSKRMRDGEWIRDMLITDRFGGVVASVIPANEPFQRNKDWWRAAFNNGNGDFAVGDVLFDKRSSSWCVPFAGPIRDKDNELIGVYQVLVDIGVFFRPISDIRMGHTGILAIVDSRGYMVFYPNLQPFSRKLCSYEELQKLLTSSTETASIKNVYGHKGSVIAGFARINDPLFVKCGINWNVVALKDNGEIYGTINRFIFNLSLACLALISLVLAATAYIFNSVFIGPVEKLEEWIVQVGNGNINLRMNVKGNDFIEELAEPLNGMLDNLAKNMVPATVLKKVSDKTAALEKDVKNRNDNLYCLIKNDLVQPIMSMQHAADILKGEAALKEHDKARRAIEAVVQNVHDIKKTTDKLAYLTGIDSGNLDLKMEKMDARALLKNSMLTFESRASARGLELKIDVPKTPAPVLADPARINDVLNILLENAIKSTDSGHVELSIRYLPNDVEFSVSDTGNGMPEEALAHIFDRSHTSKASLSIAKGVIEAHKGIIFAESRLKNGTRIFFRLPIAST